MVNETSNIGQIANILNIITLRLGYLVNSDDLNKSKLIALDTKKYVDGISIGLRLLRTMPEQYLELEKEAEDIYSSELSLIEFIVEGKQ